MAEKGKVSFGVFVIVALLLLVGIGDAYVVRETLVKQRGTLFDFYPIYTGARAVLLHRNPYTDEVTHTIQRGIYGRLATSDENQHGYAYPAYAAFILPICLLPFPVATALWLTAQQFLLLASLLLIKEALGWKLGSVMTILLGLATMLFKYSMIVFVLGQTSILILFFMSVAFWAAQRRQDIMSGFCLALMTIKPPLVFLLIPIWLFVTPPSRRRGVFLGLSGTLLGLLLLSWLFVGNWLGDFLLRLQNYRRYTGTQPPLSAFLGHWLALPHREVINLILTALLIAWLIAVIWKLRQNENEGEGNLGLSLSLGIMVTLLVAPQTGSYNLVLALFTVCFCLWFLQPLARESLPARVGQVTAWLSITLIPWLLWLLLLAKPALGYIDLVIMPGIILAVLIYVVKIQMDVWRTEKKQDEGQAMRE